MNRRKSADGMVVTVHGDEGRNMQDRRDAEVSLDEGDAGRMTEMSEDCRRVTGRTCEGKDRERQTSVATEGDNSSKVTDAMKEFMRRYKPPCITTTPSASPHEPPYAERHVRKFFYKNSFSGQMVASLSLLSVTGSLIPHCPFS